MRLLKTLVLTVMKWRHLDLRNKCKEYALECVETQKQDFIRFGVLGEWDRPYLTLRPEFEVKQLGIFGEMAKRGHIYKGLKTVYWCTHCETALAEAEIEYAEKKSFSIYVKFPYVSEKKVTLPAGVDPKQAYCCYLDNYSLDNACQRSNLR